AGSVFFMVALLIGSSGMGRSYPDRLAVRRPSSMLSPMLTRRRALVLAVVAASSLAVAGVARGADKPLHLVLTPSQKPTDLLAAGEEFGRVLGGLVGTPVRVTVASDYAAVIEALRNQTADLAFVHPAGYVLAN